MRVLQLIDSLETGGAERMAITLANGLAASGIPSFLIATRLEGPLKSSIDSNVTYAYLNKRNTLDVFFLIRLFSFIRRNNIEIIHAHSSSFFQATLVKILKPRLKLVWHDHYGNSDMLNERKYVVLRWASQYFNTIISVNETLKFWAKEHLKCRNVVFLKNFADKIDSIKATISLKGVDGKRIVCLANIRPQKDHLNLLKAYRIIKMEHPEYSLHLIGKIMKNNYSSSLKAYITQNQINDVYFYNAQIGVLELLKSCNIGVLSSKSEGLPVALLEYGLAGLAVVATRVGDCELVINNKGKLVPPEDASELALAIGGYIKNDTLRIKHGLQLKEHIVKEYSLEAVLPVILNVYKK